MLYAALTETLCCEHFAVIGLDPAYHNGGWSQFKYKVKTNKQSEGAQGNSLRYN